MILIVLLLTAALILAVPLQDVVLWRPRVREVNWQQYWLAKRRQHQRKQQRQS